LISRAPYIYEHHSLDLRRDVTPTTYEREGPYNSKYTPFLHLIAWKTKGKRASIIHVGFQAYYLVMGTSHAAQLEENNQYWVSIRIFLMSTESNFYKTTLKRF
jgi:hypothetical protein